MRLGISNHSDMRHARIGSRVRMQCAKKLISLPLVAQNLRAGSKTRSKVPNCQHIATDMHPIDLQPGKHFYAILLVDNTRVF